MRILDRLPVDDKHHRLDIHGESLRIRPFQIIVEVSISDALTWDARIPIIPAGKQGQHRRHGDSLKQLLGLSQLDT